MRFTSFITSAFASAVLVKQGLARNCTTEDLTGSYGTFRFTNNFTSYSAGTDQVVSFDHPSDSPITGVQSIALLACGDDDESIDSVTVDGLPVTFPEDAADKSGTIRVSLPHDLASGLYTYRLTLTTSTDQCYLYSDHFTSTGPILEACSEGEGRCLDASTYLGCVVDNNSTQGSYSGPVQDCPAGTGCIQSGALALCSASSAGPDTASCVPGTMRCTNETAWVQCIGAGDAWAYAEEPISCGPGTACGVYQTDYIICQ